MLDLLCIKFYNPALCIEILHHIQSHFIIPKRSKHDLSDHHPHIDAVSFCKRHPKELAGARGPTFWASRAGLLAPDRSRLWPRPIRGQQSRGTYSIWSVDACGVQRSMKWVRHSWVCNARINERLLNMAPFSRTTLLAIPSWLWGESMADQWNKLFMIFFSVNSKVY